MLIARRDGELVLVEQVEHGRIAGELAASWGNELFAAPQPRDSVLRAAALHDEGFRPEDAKPLYNAREQRPLGNARELPLDRHVALYRRGVEAVLERDPYAGLLVSMHWTGLYGSRWGMQARPVGGELSAAEQRLRDEVIEAEQRRWIGLGSQLLGNGRRSEFEAQLWHNFDLLQAWDVLSLFLCSWDLRQLGGAARPRTVVETLGALEQEPGPRLLLGVPLAVGGPRVGIWLSVVEPGVVGLHPYPFSSPAVAIEVAARRIADRAYGSQAEVAAALEAARGRSIELRLRPLGV